MEYDPLFEPGFRDIEIHGIPELFVEGFENPGPREYLVGRLLVFLSMVKDIGIDFEIWLDGSFATQKPSPGDIDVAVFFNQSQMNSLSPEKTQLANHLFSNTQATRLRYCCDVYLTPDDNSYQRSYWRGWFGFDRNERPKGIPRLYL